jgi:hypothetical protein
MLRNKYLNENRITFTEYNRLQNWFDNLVKMFPNKVGQTQKGVEHTSPLSWLNKLFIKGLPGSKNKNANFGNKQFQKSQIQKNEKKPNKGQIFFKNCSNNKFQS